MESTIRHIRTELQDIMIEKSDNDLRLTLDGDLQFSFSEDAIYTDAMTRIPMSCLSTRSDIRVLILGGGDGLIADAISRYPHISRIDLCELDSGMIDLCKSDSDIREFNHDIFSNPILHIHIADAYSWIAEQTDTYDLIIADLPNAHRPVLSQLFSREFYLNIDTILWDDGVFITLGSETQHTPKCFECIIATMREIWTHTLPFSIDMPSTYGNIWLILAARSDIGMQEDIAIYRPQYQNEIEINTTMNYQAYFYFDAETQSSRFIPGITNRDHTNAA